MPPHDTHDGELPAPELNAQITHLWIVPRYLPGLTMVWFAATGWEGSAWDWGHPAEVLDAWNDPVCPDNHSPKINADQG